MITSKQSYEIVRYHITLYPYRCRTCDYKEWTEDIFVDSFPPDGPGDCPTLCCPECGGDFVCDVAKKLETEQ